jgi:glycosyltransferase involved in cell wall biosynthesis
MQEIRRSLFPEIKSVVVHNGADPIPDIMFDAPRPADIEGRLVVNCVSIWYDRKGIPKLIEAFGRIAGDFPNAVLRLVGDGPDLPAVMAAIKASPAKQQIQVLGSQSHERAMQEMCWSDIFALIGRDEPYGVVFTEAMMAGLPLIWPSDCGHNDVLSDGVHGIKVPPWDVDATAAALRKLLGDAELRQKIGHENRTYTIKQLTWDANASKMLEIFHGAAQKSTPRIMQTIQ